MELFSIRIQRTFQLVSTRINRSQYAERIVKGPRFDGRGTRLQSVGLHIRVRCGDSVGGDTLLHQQFGERRCSVGFDG